MVRGRRLQRVRAVVCADGQRSTFAESACGGQRSTADMKWVGEPKCSLRIAASTAGTMTRAKVQSQSVQRKNKMRASADKATRNCHCGRAWVGTHSRRSGRSQVRGPAQPPGGSGRNGESRHGQGRTLAHWGRSAAAHHVEKGVRRSGGSSWMEKSCPWSCGVNRTCEFGHCT
jgi:hypothetical protein